LSLRLTEADLAKIQAKFKKNTTSHLIDTSQGVAKERAKKSKYGNVKTEVEGIEFSSSKEAKRYKDLRLLENAGVIQKLKRQVRFSLEVNGVHICDYICDFTYQQKGFVCEDAKGYRTKDYKMKARLMLAIHQIKILET